MPPVGEYPGGGAVVAFCGNPDGLQRQGHHAGRNLLAAGENRVDFARVVAAGFGAQRRQTVCLAAHCGDDDNRSDPAAVNGADFFAIARIRSGEPTEVPPNF